MLLASLALGSGLANAKGFDKWGITPESFFSYERAKGYWADLRTRDQLMERAAVCDAGPYAKWEKQFWKQGKALEKSFADDPQAEEIRACYDLQQTWFVYDNVRHECAVDWDGKVRGTGKRNIFTKSCDDIPDWREKK